MGQILYLRPREKIRDRGVRSLSNSELLQVIIGSGSQGLSAARIAKNIAQFLEQIENPSYQELLRIRGLGHAKVCQIMAALELSNRLKKPVSSVKSIPPAFKKIKASSKRTVEYQAINGVGEYTLSKSEVITDIAQASLAIRKMFADALHSYADSLLVGIGSRTHTIDILDDETLEVMKMIFDTASLLEIKVNIVWQVNQTSQQPFRRKALQ
ncbi:MAG: UPF0758 domain-containing protein [Candidatus Saccharimonadaceae bacterium]